MTTSGEVGLMVLGFIAFFVLIWCFVLWVTSFASGWRRLAQCFGATFEFTGEVASFTSARIGWANYNGALITGASEQGLYLVPIRIFRPFHHPLFIPWSEIETDPRESAIMPRMQMTFPSVPGKRIYLYGRSATQCMPHLLQSRLDPTVTEHALLDSPRHSTTERSRPHRSG